MNKFFLPLLLLLCGATLGAQQNQLKSFNALSARVLAIDHKLPNEEIEEASPTYAIELGFRRQFNKYLALAAPLKIGLIDVGQLDNLTIAGVDLLGQLYPLGNEGKVSPYLHAGLGVISENFDDANHQLPLGLGFNFSLGPNSWFSVQGEYRLSNQTRRDNVMAGLGYVYRITSLDSDGDGIVNRDDACPQDVGGPGTNGCPDTDGDGVADKDDKCPGVAGLAQYEGCPDTDLDGTPDANDDCPEDPGPAATKGCPDTDGDGVADNDDRCPDQAGTAALNGCPDTDGDGVADNEDNCPAAAGPKELMGCPDTDGDGISDGDDKCPTVAGDAPLGCPDADGDGVADKDDRCPDQAGTAALNGCPDTDGDGVADDADRCPSQAGPATNEGCPVIEEAVQERLEYAARAVQFETGSAQLKESSYVVLSEVAGIMREYRDYNLTISGHTDNVGSDVNNLSLSERRAEACRKFIVATGISSSRISSTGYGETRPVADNATAAGRRENRRVAFELVVK